MRNCAKLQNIAFHQIFLKLVMKMKWTTARAFTALIFALFFPACSGHTEEQKKLSDQEKKDEWVLLFDGASTKGWHIFNRGEIPSAWSADSGNFVCYPHEKNIKHGELVADKEYGNFDLLFEWKISKAGNSGLFINVQERPALGTTFSTGPECQLLDDLNMEAEYLKNLSHKAALFLE